MHDGDTLEPSSQATNPVRLMSGEDPKTLSLERTDHWIGAYTELLAFKDKLLYDMESGIKDLSQPAGREIRELDVTMVEIQRKRYQMRLAFWQSRRLELVGKA
jgi:hypothetical protein